jgi:hypothetical protein
MEGVSTHILKSTVFPQTTKNWRDSVRSPNADFMYALKSFGRCTARISEEDYGLVSTSVTRHYGRRCPRRNKSDTGSGLRQWQLVSPTSFKASSCTDSLYQDHGGSSRFSKFQLRRCRSGPNAIYVSPLLRCFLYHVLICP